MRFSVRKYRSSKEKHKRLFSVEIMFLLHSQLAPQNGINKLAQLAEKKPDCPELNVTEHSSDRLPSFILIFLTLPIVREWLIVKHSSSVCCHHPCFTAPDQVGASPLSNRKYQTWLIFTIPSQVASNGSAASEREQSGKRQRRDVAFFSQCLYRLLKISSIWFLSATASRRRC